MRILVNEQNEITGYATVGSLGGDIEVDSAIIPQDFFYEFKPKRFIYENNRISINENFSENDETSSNVNKPEIDLSGSDKELRSMFANMQEQLVQGNTMVMEVTQQNAKLTQEIVELKNEIEAIKGEGQDEDVISNV